MNNPVRIVLVEDDPLLLDGMKNLLNNSGKVEVVAAFLSAEDFIVTVDRIVPQVVLMDIGLPGMNGIRCIEELKPRHPSMEFLMWTTFEDDEKIFDALRSGASGYLLKNSPVEVIAAGIEDVLNGGSPMSSSIARRVIDSFRPEKNIAEEYNLTAREREILGLLGKGYRYKEIAAQLSISVETVRKHIRNMYVKLQVQSRTDALNKVFPR
jgi:DNA-binding NarL/FixJ family response regulator